MGYDCVWSLNKCVFPEVTLYSTRQSYVENITELKQNASNDGELISFFFYFGHTKFNFSLIDI